MTEAGGGAEWQEQEAEHNDRSRRRSRMTGSGWGAEWQDQEDVDSLGENYLSQFTAIDHSDGSVIIQFTDSSFCCWRSVKVMDCSPED